MGKDVSLTITKWCDSNWPNDNECHQLDVLSLFPTPGTYRIYVAVDSWGNIPETPTTPAEQNNILQKDISIIGTQHTNLVPVIFRP